MTKVIAVEDCQHCPWSESIDMGVVCKKASWREIVVGVDLEDGYIPEWCPLDNVVHGVLIAPGETEVELDERGLVVSTPEFDGLIIDGETDGWEIETV